MFEIADISQLDAAIPMREVTRTLETRDELWDAPLFYMTIVICLTAGMAAEEEIPNDLVGQALA